MKSYTIGMAGHIDHGKTSLTKALTGIDTDRLKEEKERQISIEPGYAHLQIIKDMNVSIVDVPGHEKFIRQMIAGVAGIDMVILVIAADEGVMPQTKEHLEILSFLDIEHGMVVISKIDKVDQELLELVLEDVQNEIQGTIFERHNPHCIDSVSLKGIKELQESIQECLLTIEPRKPTGSFRLPIDQAFTLQGKGTIIRGTINEGKVREGDQLFLFPDKRKVKVRQVQVHRQKVEEASSGQRAAINISGINTNEVKRGDVLYSNSDHPVSDVLDIYMKTKKDFEFPLKQRARVKLHIGTTEMMGVIVFFDRNSLLPDEEGVLCQLRLDSAVAAKRGDRFVIRRPTPVETLGGGWVINPYGERYKFGSDTILMLQEKKEQTPTERILDALSRFGWLSKAEIEKETSLSKEIIESVIQGGIAESTLYEATKGRFVLTETSRGIKKEVVEKLQEYHHAFSLKRGINKPELIQMLNETKRNLIEYVLDQMLEQKEIIQDEQYIRLVSFECYAPSHIEERVNHLLTQINQDGITAKNWDEYITSADISQKDKEDILYYLLHKGKIFKMGENIVIHKHSFQKAVEKLKAATNYSFTLKEAKDTLDVSRKYIIPFLELLDRLAYTERDEDKRIWM